MAAWMANLTARIADLTTLIRNRALALRVVRDRVHQHVRAAAGREKRRHQEEARRRQFQSLFHSASPFHLLLLACAPVWRPTSFVPLHRATWVPCRIGETKSGERASGFNSET